MARQRRSFSEEFKREAVKLVAQSGSSKADIARDLGVSGSLLARWYREEEASKSPAARSVDAVSAEEYERMRRELAKVKTERDILKMALGYFAAEPK
jgi:transposase